METECEDLMITEQGTMTRRYAPVIGFHHHAPWPAGNLYFDVRKVLGLSQVKFAELTGMTYAQVRYRERIKRQYGISEILFLKEISGLGWEEFEELLEGCA